MRRFPKVTHSAISTDSLWVPEVFDDSAQIISEVVQHDVSTTAFNEGVRVGFNSGQEDAYYDAYLRAFIFGETLEDSFRKASLHDLVAHEMFHRVLQYDFSASSQSHPAIGGLNEHLCDVVGLLAKLNHATDFSQDDPWAIGVGAREGRYSIRRMDEPGSDDGDNHVPRWDDTSELLNSVAESQHKYFRCSNYNYLFYSLTEKIEESDFWGFANAWVLNLSFQAQTYNYSALVQSMLAVSDIYQISEIFYSVLYDGCGFPEI